MKKTYRIWEQRCHSLSLELGLQSLPKRFLHEGHTTLQLARDVYEYSHQGAALHREADEALQLATSCREQMERERESMDTIKVTRAQTDPQS